MCRVGCKMNPVLSRTARNALLCTTFTPRPSFPRLDLTPSLQYGIVVMGVIDVLCLRHNHHRRNMDNLGNFGGCMKGRNRFMTAITPAYAHADKLI